MISTGSGEPKCSTTKLGVLERICEDDWFKRPDILLLLKKKTIKASIQKNDLKLVFIIYFRVKYKVHITVISLA